VHRIFITIHVILLVVACSTQPETNITITVKNESLATLDDRMFGQFIEKPSWHGEWGPEAALVPGTHVLQEGVEHLMKKMKIPVLRFPGGTDVNQQDWTTMIDNVPGRTGERHFFVGNRGDTVSNNFGYDEVCQLAERLGSEVMIVINFGDAYFKRKPLKQAVLHETGLLAYLNLEVGAELPPGMPDWPSVRAKNGRERPYKVRYIQIANEPWVLDSGLKKQGAIENEKKEQYFKCLDAFINAFKEIDPEIEIIADGNSEEITTPLRKMFGDKISYLAYHIYKPWGIREIFQNGQKIPLDSITPEEAWNAWIAVPGIDENGQSAITDQNFNTIAETGYPIAVTEWNWNGWWSKNPVSLNTSGLNFTKGIGAAGFIHAFMRNAEKVKIGTQSMLVGKSWGITGIRVSPTLDFKPHPYPTGEITGFYSRLHGKELMKVNLENIPGYEQPYKMNGILPSGVVAKLDVLATASHNKVFVHIINREFVTDVKVKFDLKEFENLSNQCTLHTYTANPKNKPAGLPANDYGIFNKLKSKLKNNAIYLTLPKRSVCILEIDKTL